MPMRSVPLRRAPFSRPSAGRLIGRPGRVAHADEHIPDQRDRPQPGRPAGASTAGASAAAPRAAPLRRGGSGSAILRKAAALLFAAASNPPSLEARVLSFIDQIVI